MVFQLTLEHTESKLNNITCNEKYDLKLLNKLISSSLLNIDPWNNHENEKEQLKKYSKTNGVIKYKRNCKFGRVYGIGSLGLQNLRKELRHTISRDYYFDIDIVNAHPEILLQILQQNKIKNIDYLQKYVKNRDKYLNEVMKKFNVDRDTAKSLFIIIMYGGSVKTWTNNKDNKDIDGNKINDKIMYDFIDKFHNEMIQIQKIISDNNKEIEKEIKKSKDRNNINSSITSYYLQEIENRILEEIFKYCKENEFINDENNCVLCFDGIMLDKKNFKQDLLNDLNNLIKEKFKLDLTFVCKDMNHGYTEDEIDESQVETIDVDKVVDLLNEKLIADYYYQFFEPSKYIIHKKIWYEFNKLNILKECDGTPSSLLNDITDKFQNLIIEARDKLKKPTQKESDKDEEYKAKREVYFKKFKTYDNAYKAVGKSKFIKGVMDYLINMYNDDDLEKKKDCDNNIIAFKDGYLFDITKNEFRKIERTDYISKTMNINSPQNIIKEKLESVKSLISSIFENEEISRYWLKIFGISLFTNKLESLYILTGKGGNGKSLLMDFLRDCLGDYYLQTENTFLTDISKNGVLNPTLAKCKGVRILAVAEPSNTSEEVALNTEFIKQITGRDTITARDLYKSIISYNPMFNCFLLCNDIPVLKKLDNGMLRRLKIINYPLNFVEKEKLKLNSKNRIRDDNLKDKIKNDEELKEALISLLLEYASKYINKPIEIPNECKQTTDEYIENNNPVLVFLQQRCIITEDNKDKIKTQELFNQFKYFNREDKIDVSRFYKDMAFNGFEICKSHGDRIFKGIKLKEEKEDDTDE